MYVETLLDSEAKYNQYEHFAKFFGYDSIDDYEEAVDGGIDFVDKFFEWGNKIIAETKDEDGFAFVSDIISGYTNDANSGSVSTGGHSASYWASSTPQGYASRYQIEAWAEYCSLKATGNHAMIDVLKSVLPQEAEAIEKVYNEVFR